MSVDVMEVIWSESFQMQEEARLSPLASLVSSIMSVPTVCISCAGTEDGVPLALYADQEVMAGASLADILFEEHGVEISDDTVVLFEPRGPSNATPVPGMDLGGVLGEVLVTLAGPQHQIMSKKSDAMLSLEQSLQNVSQLREIAGVVQ